MEVDTANDLYFYGITNGSTTGIATQIAHQSTLQNNPDNFLVKFEDCLSSLNVSSNSPVCVGSTVELNASGGTIYSWIGPNGFVSTLANPTIPMAGISNSGEYFCTISSTEGCNSTKSLVIIVGDGLAPVADVASLSIITGNCNALTILVPTATEDCLGIISATTESPLVFITVGTYTIVWNYTDGINSTTQNHTVVISQQSLPTALSPQIFCTQENAILNDLIISSQDLRCYDATTLGNLLSASTPIVNGTTYYVSQTINDCESSRIPIIATIYETPAPSGLAVQTFCETQVLTIVDLVVNGADILFYKNAAGGNLLPMETTLINGYTYYASLTMNSCESIGQVAFTPAIISGVPANDYSEMRCDDLNDGFEIVNLSSFISNLITNAATYTFEYYSNFSAAENQNSASEITNFSNYTLSIGVNTFYVRVMFANACYKVFSLKLHVISLPKLNMNDPMQFVKTDL